MGQSIIVIVGVLAGVLLGAWITYRAELRLPPVPEMPRKDEPAETDPAKPKPKKKWRF